MAKMKYWNGSAWVALDAKNADTVTTNANLNGEVTSVGNTTTIATGINATKIANGTVSNTEFQYLDGATSNIQTQINARADEIGVLSGDISQRAANVKSAPYDAKGDGTANDTAAIQQALDSGKDVFIPAGTFMIDALLGLNIPSNTTLYMTPKTVLKVITNSAEVYNVLRINNVSNIRVYGNGASIIGERSTHTGTTGEWGYGIQFNNSTFVHIDGLTIKDMWGDGINLDSIGGLQSNVNRNIIITNVTCDNNRRQGISISGVEDMLVENCRFTGTNGTAPAAGIDFEPSFPGIWNKRVVLRDCVLQGNAGVQMVVHNNTEGIRFYDCQFAGTSTSAIWLDGLSGSENSFENCTITGVSQHLQNAKFSNCLLSSDNTSAAAGGSTIITNEDVYLEFHRCTVKVTGNRNLMYIGWSTSEATRKVFSECTFIQDGNQFPDTQNVLVTNGLYTFTDTKFLHTGANPATGYLIGVGGADGTNQKLINCYIDPVFSNFYGLSGWVTINKTYKLQEGWINAALQNSWVAIDPVGYYKDELGVVRLHGFMNNGTTGVACFTLPVGYRPAQTFRTLCNSDNTAVGLSINLDGTVVVASKVNWVALDNITFRASS